MSEETDRNRVRDATQAGGWTITWGDLINELAVVQLIVSIPTGTVGAWVSSQVEVQLQKFQQRLSTVSDDVVKEATDYVKDLLARKSSGERDIQGLGVKAGIVTYHRKLKTPLGSTKLPNNHQPHIGLRVTKPLPPKGGPTAGSLSSSAWYKIRNTARPGMALDVVNDGNQQRDGKLQMATDGNFSGHVASD